MRIVSKETRDKMRVAFQKRKVRDGYILSPEARKKISLANKGKERLDIRGENHPNWNNGRTITTQGYVAIYNPYHPFANNRGYVVEHRLIMEKKINRFLRKEEVVHHINNIKTDNRIENLMIVTRRNHFGELLCPHCLNKFFVK